MHYFLYPTKDTYITNDPAYILKNVGLDEILQVQKSMSDNSCGSVSGSMAAVLSRTLMQFDLSQISQSISTGSISNPTFTLNMKICESSQVGISYNLLSFPLGTPWFMGTGYRYDGSTTFDGTNWKFEDNGSIKWNTTGSLVDCSGGGIWYVSSSIKQDTFAIPISGGYACSQSYNYNTSDISMNVSTIVNAWLSGSIPNNGLIVMQADETSSIDYGVLKFFSKETNTIYSPYLDVAWADYTFNTGSTDPIYINEAVVDIKNMMSEYKFGSVIRFNVTARKRYPVKTFTNMLSDYLVPYYLPLTSYYSIKDAESEEEVIPYDQFTQLSFDTYGNFFMIDTTGLPSERYYRVEIRSEQNGAILTFPISTTFKISR